MALNPRQKLLKQDAFKKKTTAQRVLEAEQKRKGIVPVVDQAPTIDPNAPRLGDDRKKGVFTNSAGQTVNSAGRPVEANGKPIADPTAEEPLATYGEIGEANIQAEYDANQATELDLTGATSGYSSMDEYFKDLFASQKENTQLSREQLELQRQQGVETTTDQKNAIMGGVETAQGQLTGSREGVTSGSNQTTLGRYQTVAGQQIQRLQQAQDLSAKAIEQAQVNLDRAERAGNTQLAEQYRSQLLSAESQAQQTETDLINALSSQATTESAIQTENITTFQGLIDEGQELSVETISGFAKKLGIDFDTAYGYYAGVQNIRDDKTLSLEEKEVLLAKEKDNLDKQLRGITTESAKNIDYLNQLRQMGASEEIISAFKSSAGITDYDDPLTQADLEYKQLENEIKRKQMNGEPVSVSDYETLFDLKQKMDASAGTGGTAYVSPSIDGISMTYEGGQLNVTLPTNPDGTLKAYQCGEFVNRAWGLSAGGANGFGSTSADKQNLVSKNGFFTEGKSFPELLGLIKPGMAFASYAGSTDHTGLIVSAPDAQGNYMTLEANVGDNNPNVSDPPIYKTRNIKDQDVYGFVYPPNGQPVQGASGGTMDAQIRAVAADIGATEADRAQVASDLKSLVDQGYSLSEAKSMTGYISKSDKELQKNMEDEIKDNRTNFNEINSKLASIPSLIDSDSGIGDVATIVNFLKVIDPNSVARETEVQSVENATSLLGRFDQAFNKAASGEKLTKDQRNDILQASNILRTSMADYYLTQLYGRQQELEGLGVPMTFTSQTQISELERVVGADRAELIKQSLGLSSAPIDEDSLYQEAESQAQFDSLAGSDDEADINSIFNQ